MNEQNVRFGVSFNRFENSFLIYILINMIIGVMFFIITHYTPFFEDDLTFSKIWGTDETAKTVKDAAMSSWLVYNDWSGRMIPVFLNCVLQLQSKMLYNVVNSVFFLLLVNLIYKHALGEKRSNIYLCVIYLGFWFCLQNFGSTVIWMSASIEYMWSSALVLLFLLPYNRSLRNFEHEKELFGKPFSIMFPVVFCIFGAIVCSFSEIVGITVCVFILLVLSVRVLPRYISRSKVKKYSLWEITGFIGAIIGSAFVTFAPGSFNRLHIISSIVPDQPNIILEIGYRITRTTYYMCVNMWPLFMLFLIFLLICRFSDESRMLSFRQFISKHIIFGYYLLASLSGVLIFIFAKGYSNRFLVISVAMLLIAIGIVYARLELSVLGKSLATVTLLFTIAFASLQYVTGALLIIRDSDLV